MLAGLAVVAVVAVTLLSFGAAAPVVMGAIAVGGGAVIAKGISDCISGTVSSRESHMKAGFWGAVTGAAAAIGGAATAAAKAPTQVASLAAKSSTVKKMLLDGCDGVWDTLKENATWGQETTFKDLAISFAMSAFTAGQGDELYRGYNKVDGLIEDGVKQIDEIVEGVAKQTDEVVEGVVKQADEVAEGIAKQTDEVIERAAEHSDELIESTAKQADELVEGVAKQADETLGMVGQKADMGYLESTLEPDFYVGPNGKILPSQYKDWIGKNMQKELIEQAENPQLQNAIKQLYRGNSFIGDGGTADVIRFEQQIGLMLGKNGGSHVQKGMDMAKYIENKILTSNLSPSDRSLATQLLENLYGALGR